MPAYFCLPKAGLALGCRPWQGVTGWPVRCKTKGQRGGTQPRSLPLKLPGMKLFFFQIEALFETVYTAAGIYQLLLAGEERMTFRTNIYTNFFFGRAGFKFSAASAFYGCNIILRMNSLFHIGHPFQNIA